MQTPHTDIIKVKALPFVDDVMLSSNGHLYIVSLRYEYPDILPASKNYLTLESNDFTADKVIDSFDKVIVQYYRSQLSKAEGLLHDARQKQAGLGDIMNEL